MKTQLNQRGIAHYLVPLMVVVAVTLAGVSMLVASHADVPSNASASTAKAKKAKPKLVKVSVANLRDDDYGLAVSTEVRNNKGERITRTMCNGGKLKVVVKTGGKTVLNRTITASYTEKDPAYYKADGDNSGYYYNCVFEAENSDFACKGGKKYSVKLTYLGNDYFGMSNSKTINRACKHVQPSISGGIISG